MPQLPTMSTRLSWWYYQSGYRPPATRRDDHSRHELRCKTLDKQRLGSVPMLEELAPWQKVGPFRPYFQSRIVACPNSEWCSRARPLGFLPPWRTPISSHHQRRVKSSSAWELRPWRRRIWCFRRTELSPWEGGRREERCQWGRDGTFRQECH